MIGRNLDLLVPQPFSPLPGSRWATVTQENPLRIQLDGDTQALPYTPDSLVAGLRAGDRVWVVLAASGDQKRRARRVVVIGRATPSVNFLSIQIFTESGTWNRPDGGRVGWVRCVGGGGAGGGAQAAGSGQHAAGSGGGAGGYAEGWFDLADLPSSIPVTVGAGGVGQTGANGGNGGTTSFGSFVVATGGGGGNASSSSSAAFGISPGSGGVGTAGHILGAGSPGFPAWGDAQFGMSGAGGSGPFGAGGAGRATPAGGAQSLSGVSGSGYGSGGSGGLTQSGGGAVPGGNGASGLVAVIVFH